MTDPGNLFLVALTEEERDALVQMRPGFDLSLKLTRAVPFEKAVEAAATEYRRYPYRASTDAIFAMRAALHAASSPLVPSAARSRIPPER